MFSALINYWHVYASTATLDFFSLSLPLFLSIFYLIIFLCILCMLKNILPFWFYTFWDISRDIHDKFHWKLWNINNMFHRMYFWIGLNARKSWEQESIEEMNTFSNHRMKLNDRNDLHLKYINKWMYLNISAHSCIK